MIISKGKDGRILVDATKTIIITQGKVALDIDISDANFTGDLTTLIPTTEKEFELLKKWLCGKYQRRKITTKDLIEKIKKLKG